MSLPPYVGVISVNNLRQEYLGHFTISMTMQIYSHVTQVTQEMQEAAVEKIGGILAECIKKISLHKKA